MLIVLYNCVIIIDGEDDGLTWWMRSKAALIAVLQFVNYQKHVKILAEHKYSPKCSNGGHTVSTLS